MPSEGNAGLGAECGAVKTTGVIDGLFPESWVYVRLRQTINYSVFQVLLLQFVNLGSLLN